jgi:hypothetical protein
MVDRVGDACSDARAQVTGRILPFTHRPKCSRNPTATCSYLACAGVAEGERSGPVGDWGAREPKTGGV